MEIKIEPLNPMDLLIFSPSSIPIDLGVTLEDYDNIDDWSVRQKLDDQKAEKQHNLCSAVVRSECTDALMLREDQHEDHTNNYKIQKYQCDTCKKYYRRRSSLQSHILQMHKSPTKRTAITKQSHECKICLKTFSYKSWHHHMSTVHSIEPVKCNLCSKNFKADVYLKRHMKYVHNKEPKNLKPESAEDCQICNKTLKSKTSLHLHFKNVHSGDGKKFICDICSSQLKSKSYLLTHMRRVHYDDGKKHWCNMCFKNFRSLRYLNIHKKNTMHKKMKLKMRNKIHYETDDFDF